MECGAGTACAYDPGRSPAFQCDAFTGPAANMSFFVTSQGNLLNGGNFGGITGADSFCQTLATTAGAGGRTWRAYLSGGGQNARDRIGAGPWYNAFGQPIVDENCGMMGNCVDVLHTSQVQAPMMATEQGFHIEWENAHDIYTGSDASGMATGSDCQAWSSNSESDFATVGHSDGQGRPDNSPSSWISSHLTGCDFVSTVCTAGRGHLYCFAID